jgi:hypothetical protein
MNMAIPNVWHLIASNRAKNNSAGLYQLSLRLNSLFSWKTEKLCRMNFRTESRFLTHRQELFARLSLSHGALLKRRWKQAFHSSLKCIYINVLIQLSVPSRENLPGRTLSLNT